MEITDISATAFQAVGDDSMSLEDRAAKSLGAIYAQSGMESSAILNAANDPKVAANPQALMDLQLAMHQHTLDATIYSLLAKHGADTVSTLLKS